MRDENGFYTGVGLLSRLDANKRRPIIYIADLNRSRGKTKYFKCLSMRKGRKDGFVTLPYRSRIDLINAGDDLIEFARLWFPSAKCDYVFKNNDYIGRFYMDGVHTLSTVALRYATALKNFGAVLSQTSAFFFDELQPENGIYLPDEYAKFRSIYQTAARAPGKRFREIPVYVATNPYTLFNPYYQAWGVIDKVNLTSQFVCGDGWVMEQYDDPEYLMETASNPVISSDIKYGKESIYLNESKSVIPKCPPGAKYLLNISKDNYILALFQMADGNIWVSDKPDKTRKTVLLYDGIASETKTLITRYARMGALRFRSLSSRGALARVL